MMSRSMIKQAIAAEWTYAQAASEHIRLQCSWSSHCEGWLSRWANLGILRCAIHVSLMITTVDYYKDARSMIKQAIAAKWT